MEFRQLGRSGFKVPVLSFGTGTFGGKGATFSAWGATDVAEASRLIDIALEASLAQALSFAHAPQDDKPFQRSLSVVSGSG
jgi:predicted aldo/keto reductase-like oxidoreductase